MLRDEQKEQAAKLKDRPFKEKLSYFWTYNKGPVIIVIFIILFAIGIWQTTEKYDKNALRIIIADHYGDDIRTETLTSLYEAASDTPAALDFDSTLFLSAGYSETAVAYTQKLYAMLSSNGIDVFIAPESVFEQYGSQGMFSDLSTLLSEEQLKKLTDNDDIFYVELEGDEDTEETENSTATAENTVVTAGIRLEGSQLLTDAGIEVENPCIGIPASAAHPEEALRFLSIFLQ